MPEETALAPVEKGELILNPITGEAVERDDVRGLVELVLNVRELEAALRACKSAATDAFAEECSRRGVKTVEVPGSAGSPAVKVELKTGTETQWDVERLRDLLAAGLPEDRFNQLVRETVEYKVDGRIAAQIAGSNPDYARIIDSAKTVYDAKAPYLAVKKL